MGYSLSIAVIIYPDAAGSFLKALRRGEVELSDLEGKLSREQGIKFRTCPPQGHSAHGKVERKIGLIQESLTKSGLMSERATASAWQTIAKRVEREINEIPMGFLSKKTSEFANPLLRMLSPSSLKLQTRSDRAPRLNFTIPNSPEDIITTIDKLYIMWYTVACPDSVPHDVQLVYHRHNIF